MHGLETWGGQMIAVFDFILCYASAFLFGVIVGVGFMLFLDYKDENSKSVH